MNKSKFILVPDKMSKSELRFYQEDKLKVVQKAKLRSVLGRTILPSNNFTVTKVKNGFLVSGNGFGHGVGMCQFGAFELAKRGYNYSQILAYYYPNYLIKRIY